MIDNEKVHMDAYIAVRDHMKDGVPYRWGTVCTDFFGIPYDEQSDRKTQALHRVTRGMIFAAINNYAAAYGDSWRLYNYKRGLEIIKRSDERMLLSEVDARFKRTASGLKMIIQNLAPMLASNGLEKKDRALIRMMLNLSRGASLSIVGMIAQIKFLPREQRTLAISYFPKDEEE